MRRSLLALLAVVVLTAGDARAQCGAKRSTCSACHDGAQAPARGAAAWHRDHAFADVCAVCHGGAPDAREAPAAHVGVSSPLADVETRCGTCHGAAANDLAARYATASADAGPVATAPQPEPHGRHGANVVATLFAIGVAAFGSTCVVLRERRLHGRRRSWA